eukprot:scaffold85132_cov57-Phaeocystis_antarctica.AAC.2
MSSLLGVWGTAPAPAVSPQSLSSQRLQPPHGGALGRRPPAAAVLDPAQLAAAASVWGRLRQVRRAAVRRTWRCTPWPGARVCGGAWRGGTAAA